MRVVSLAVFFALLGTCMVNYAFQAKSVGAAERTPVLVELFTSEGCSSCPPVDKLVADLQTRQPIANAQVVLLSFHVDYWNELGWKDRFASHDYTLRQQQYSSIFAEDSVYTPEVIVDGAESRPESLRQQIRSATSAAKPVTLMMEVKTPGTLHISAHADNKTNARVLVAITEDGLTTNVGGGENGGRTLAHAGVVRTFVSLGSLDKGSLSKDWKLDVDPQWQRSKLMLVAFAQDARTGKVLGVSARPISELLK